MSADHATPAVEGLSSNPSTSFPAPDNLPSSIRHSEETVTWKSFSIYREAWIPTDPRPVAMLYICHGMHEYCSRYKAVLGPFLRAGVSVFALDLPGHGRSSGTRAVVPSLIECAQELCLQHVVQSAALPECAGLPLFIFGHSMGGTTAILLSRAVRATLGARFRGLILSSPAVFIEASAALVAVGRMVAKVAPRMPIQGFDPNSVSVDPKKVERYTKDPMVFHGGVRSRTAIAIVDAMRCIASGVAADTTPILIMFTPNDTAVSPAGVKKYFALCPAADKTLREFPACRHELLLEAEGPEILATIVQWIQAHRIEASN